MPALGKQYFFISSLEKGMRVLELLAETGPLSVSEVAAHLGYNRAAGHRFLATFKELGYLEQTEDNRYQLTFKLFILGQTMVSRFDIRAMARPLMTELSAAFGETINLGRLEGRGVLHIDKIDSTEVLRMDSPVGSHAPVYCTAMGKVILAFLPKKERECILNKLDMKIHGPHTITSPDALLAECQAIRSNGFAVDNEELAKGLRCVAAPIFDSTGTPRFAISVAGPTSRINRGRMKKIQNEVQRVCQTLSTMLGNSAITHPS